MKIWKVVWDCKRKKSHLTRDKVKVLCGKPIGKNPNYSDVEKVDCINCERKKDILLGKVEFMINNMNPELKLK